MARIEDPTKDVNLRVALQRRFLGYALEAGTLARAAGARLSGRPRPETKFLIFGRGRSGSTLLTKLLDSHDDIACYGEILRYRSIAPGLQLRLALDVAPARVAGCKMLSYQMRTIHGMPTNSRFLHDLADQGVQIIYLKRTNLLRHAISNLYARKRGAYHSSDRKADKAATVTILPEEIEAWMDGSAALNDYEQAVLAGVPHTSLTYEGDLSNEEDQMRTYRRLLDQFGLPYTEPKIALRKVTPSDMTQIIENHATLIPALQNSKYGHFLDA